MSVIIMTTSNDTRACVILDVYPVASPVTDLPTENFKTLKNNIEKYTIFKADYDGKYGVCWITCYLLEA